MKRYLIKVTYLEGRHAGESHLLRKGGYVTDEDSIHFDDWTYKTKGIAERVCRHLKEENDLSRRIERKDEAVAIKLGLRKGPKDWYIYEDCSYEPFEVEAVSI